MKTRGTVFILHLPGTKGLSAGTPPSPARGRDVSWSPGWKSQEISVPETEISAPELEISVPETATFNAGQLHQELDGFRGFFWPLEAIFSNN